ncbi:hypothetical protein ALC152_21970 [Arcobacter sp. 15-2]|uniref:EAL domain-containing protein n=1 Tax=Arcobacter sp. 15-2 TaxID=3374109 RepID=UPI00399C9833
MTPKKSPVHMISNRNLILKITLFILMTSIIFILLSSVLLKHKALDDLAEDDALKTSELIFETMNTRMQEGWAKDDLTKIINRLEFIREDLKVKSYRSPKVEEILGVHQADKLIVENDLLIQKAMAGEKQFQIQEDGSIRYLYPMKVSAECITCHYNTQIGDVNGVLDISYPPSQIKISLDSMTFYFIIFFIITMLIFFYIFFLIIDIKMVKPIVTLTKQISEVSNGKDFNKEVFLKTNISEMKLLQVSFNKLLKTINKYYNQLLHSIYFHKLTALPNIIKLEQDLAKQSLNSLVIINIDDFKTINYFYGTKVGDEIIKKLAKLLLQATSNAGVLYKLHGDEFAILLDKNIEYDYWEKLIDEVKRYKFLYDESTIRVTISIGIAYDEKEKIIDKVTATVRQAINENKSIKVFDESLLLEDVHTSHIQWTKNIEVALENNQIVPFFQPIKDAKTDEIIKYETLARLEKNGEIFTPDMFIDISKKSKQYDEFTRAMIRNSFEYFQDKENISFSINFSIDDIQNHKTTEVLFEYLDKFDIGDRFIVELLETEEFEDFDIINNFIQKLKTYKVKIAIDDFGSGYSNFAYIGNLQIDFLKLDSSLIENIHTNTDSYKVVKNINSFAHDMGLETIAEKVHCEEIEVLLKKLGVDYLQGYHIGKPKDSIL